MGRPSPPRETKFSGANGDREMFIFTLELTTSRIGNVARLIHTLLFERTNESYQDLLRIDSIISLAADGPQLARSPIPPIATLPSCLWSLRIFLAFPGASL